MNKTTHGKPRRRIKDPEYLEFVRWQSCYLCHANPPCYPHHIETNGIATKGSDYSCVPLCRNCHNKVEDWNWDGDFEFEWEYLYRLLRNYLEIK